MADASTAEEITLAIPGHRLAAKLWGPKGAPLVLALHGWLDNAASFDRLAPMLPGHRILALDFPGHGRSSHHPAGFLYPFVDWVADVFWVVESVGWSKFAILGHSMGAGVASMFAGTFPDRVAKLALLEGLGPMSEAADEAPIRLARALNEQRKKAGRKAPTYASREEVTARLRGAPSQMTDASAAILLGRALRDTDEGQVQWCTDRRLRFGSRVRFTEPQVLAFMRRIACPTLVVRSSEGWPFDEARMQARVDAVPNLEVLEVKGRHHVHLDYPDRVLPALQRFLGSLSRTDA